MKFFVVPTSLEQLADGTWMVTLSPAPDEGDGVTVTKIYPTAEVAVAAIQMGADYDVTIAPHQPPATTAAPAG